jgi:hypothetical protein
LSTWPEARTVAADNVNHKPVAPARNFFILGIETSQNLSASHVSIT